jgi:acyl-CoA thioester hydrolase
MAFTDPKSRFAHVITVSQADIDELGHVNNTVYLRYVEDVTRAHAIHIGMGLEGMRENGAVPVARKHIIQYHKGAMLHDQLEVSTQITIANGPRAARHNEVRLVKDGTLLVEIDSDWVWVDPVRYRPRVPAREILDAFGVTDERVRPPWRNPDSSL